MKLSTHAKLPAMWLATGLATLLVLGSAPAMAADTPLDRLTWLGGCWRSDGAETGSGEQWMPLAGGTLLGINRSVRQGVTVAHEFMQIRQQADGAVVFIAQPAGRPEGVFTLLPGAPLEAVFENVQRDFPQRVIYRLEEGGRLHARIEGQRNGAPAGVDFAFTRAPCDVQPALPEAFQGLPWGAGETQLAQRFGPALKPAACAKPAVAAPVSAAVTTRQREACDHPVLVPYDVAGVPFRLNLHLDERTRQLVRVSLVWAGEAAAATATEAGWSDKHRQLRLLLTQRYGSPESTNIHSDADSYKASARWRRGDTLVELNSTFQPRAGSSPAREQVDITYLPSSAGEAGKL